MDINKIAKEMTREEFLNSIGTNECGDIVRFMNEYIEDIEFFCAKQFCLKEYCQHNNCKKCWKESVKNIKFKGEEMKKDYDKEYNLVEVFEFEEGTEFVETINKIKYKIDNGFVLYYSDVENKWNINLFDIKMLLKMKFKLVKKDKEVSFVKAVKEYHEGKTIYCKFENKCYVYNDSNTPHREFTEECGEAITSTEILEGKWFIKEE